MAAANEDKPDFLWMRAKRPPRNSALGLSAAQIAGAAIGIADRDGVDALSMRRVAAGLGCGTMSLYRHVRTKEELLDLMIDTIAGEHGGPPKPSGDWQSDLRDAARRLRASSLRHPWLPPLSAARRSFGPNTLATIEFALSAVDGFGLSIDHMAAVIQTVHAFVHGFVLNELADQEWRSPTPSHPGLAIYIRHIIEAGQYPLFTRLAMDAEDVPDPDASFEWQLQRVLEGLAAALPDAVARGQNDDALAGRG
jgi:AcrR family transcriptional regulator